MSRAWSVVRRWGPPSAFFAIAGLAAITVGVRDDGRRSRGADHAQEAARILEEEARPEDLIYLVGADEGPASVVPLYLPYRLGNLIAGAGCRRRPQCGTEILDAVASRPTEPDRIWLVVSGPGSPWLRESLRQWGERLDPEPARRLSRGEGNPLPETLPPALRADGAPPPGSLRGPLWESDAWGDYESEIRLYRIEGRLAAATASPGSHDLEERGLPTPTGEPVIRSRFEVFRREDALVYRKTPCRPADLEARFLLELHPAAGNTPPGGLSVANRDFDFEPNGLARDGGCLAMVPIPSAGFAWFETGQVGGDSWRAAARLDEERYRAALDARAAGQWGPPLVRSSFDLYLDGSELRYFREPCAAPEVEARFFLHLFGGRGAAAAGAGAFENRDFDFAEYGMNLDGKCLAMVPLRAAGGFTRISTGQWRAGGPPLWREDLLSEHWRAGFEAVASGAWGPPAARSDFDLHREADGLWFYRSPCSPADLEARFFLHLYTEASGWASLLERSEGFENRDFAFRDYGGRRDGACLARVPLPDRRIARLRTGQFQPGGEPLWVVEIGPGPERPAAERE